MTTLHITADGLAGKLASTLFPPDMDRELRAKYLPIAKYNVLARYFNLGSILVVAATVSAVFLATKLALICGAMGFLLRGVCEDAIDRYAAPPTQAETETGFYLRSDNPEKSRSEMILHRLKVVTDPGWIENRMLVCGYVIFKSYIPIPK